MTSRVVAGVPDAPLDVQVEVGPQEGSLLVTWLPVTITTAGKSNGAVVTGYSVYVDGERVRELSSPTGALARHDARSNREIALHTSCPLVATALSGRMST